MSDIKVRDINIVAMPESNCARVDGKTEDQLEAFNKQHGLAIKMDIPFSEINPTLDSIRSKGLSLSFSKR